MIQENSKVVTADGYPAIVRKIVPLNKSAHIIFMESKKEVAIYLSNIRSMTEAEKKKLNYIHGTKVLASNQNEVARFIRIDKGE